LADIFLNIEVRYGDVVIETDPPLNAVLECKPLSQPRFETDERKTGLYSSVKVVGNYCDTDFVFGTPFRVEAFDGVLYRYHFPPWGSDYICGYRFKAYKMF
jgi:hypothetical protein